MRYILLLFVGLANCSAPQPVPSKEELPWPLLNLTCVEGCITQHWDFGIITLKEEKPLCTCYKKRSEQPLALQFKWRRNDKKNGITVL